MLLLATLLTEPSRCEALTGLTFPNTEITSARWMVASPMTTAPASGAAYPQIAKYVGVGGTNDAQNFVCADK